MDEKNVTPDTEVEDVQVEPLSDDALESVAGGAGLLKDADLDGSSGGCCSCAACS